MTLEGSFLVQEKIPSDFAGQAIACRSRLKRKHNLKRLAPNTGFFRDIHKLQDCKHDVK